MELQEIKQRIKDLQKERYKKYQSEYYLNVTKQKRREQREKLNLPNI